MKKIFIIIQARMTSTRLPKKVLLPLCGKNVLEIMLDRLDVYRDNIIIATTNDGSEKPIVDICNKLDIKYYQGEKENVLNRYFQTAVEFGLQDSDIIVRLTSDCPLIDVNILSKTIALYCNGNFDYVTSCPDSFPRGLDVEVFDFNSLKNANKNAKTTYEKEHVTPYIISNSTRIGTYKVAEKNGKYRLTLDEISDYEMIRSVYKEFGCRLDFSYDDLIELLDNNPYLHEINKHVEQKKV